MAPTTLSTDTHTAHRRITAVDAAKHTARTARPGQGRHIVQLDTPLPGCTRLLLFASRQEACLWVSHNAQTARPGGNALWLAITDASKDALGDLDTCPIHAAHPLTPVRPGEEALSCTECLHDHIEQATP